MKARNTLTSRAVKALVLAVVTGAVIAPAASGTPNQPTPVRSNVAATHVKTADAFIQNIRG